MASAGPAPTVPRQVSRFEANLLRITRFFFRQVPAEEALPLVRTTMNRPRCLSAAAVHLVRDTLGKGSVLYLVRAGGWKQERYLRGGEPKAGRLWQRNAVADLRLEFSRHSLEFLIWLTANKPGDSTPLPPAAAEELTAADQLLFFLAYEALREETDIATALRALPIIAGNALCRLQYPGDFLEDDETAIDFDRWMTGPRSILFEAMHAVLESRWLEIEHAKGQFGDWDRVRQIGQAEHAVLSQFLEAADRAKRWDLTRFVLAVLSRLLATPDMTPAFWTGGLQGSGPPRLADRLEAQRAALALLRQAERFRAWEQRARAHGYFDEDYAVGKFWLGEWERFHGAQTAERAERVLQMLEPLRSS
jgi:hypothetical protein